MASTDKTMGRLSSTFTLVVLAGIAALPLAPGSKIKPPKPTAAVHTDAPSKSDAKSSGGPSSAKQASSDAKPVEEVWTEAEQRESLRACLQTLAPVAAEVTLEEPMKQGQCGTPTPVVLHSIGTGAKVQFSPAPTMNCRLAADLARWVDTVLQPAAREVLGSRITTIVGASSYACRNVYNKPGLPLSEHATGNAVDIVGFGTADGRIIYVVKGWGPTARDIAEAQRKRKQIEEAAAKRKKKEENPAPSGSTVAEPAAKAAAEAKASVHKASLEVRKDSGLRVVPAAATLRAAKTAEATFLKRLHHGACGVFGTVLGPEANEAHRDHFHLDAKERKGRRVCH